MKKPGFILFAIYLIFASCSNSNDDNPKENESKKLDHMYNEIVKLSLSTSQSCTNSEEWSFTKVSNSKCSGNINFIVYSKKINTIQFLDKVQKYLDAQEKFDKKWNTTFPCEGSIAPVGVQCNNGKPELAYSIANF
ncbi:hypothetical protein [Flavobacterium sp.]|uniref:hypothetical protein n=1 Tax=Flavobacterium sp. TaxID=239 RepID=UPI003D104B80